MKPWKVLKSELLLDRRWLKLRSEHVRLPNGVELQEFHVLEGVDWVGCLALTDQGEVVLVDQYRHGHGAVTRELPAGVIEPSETPEQAARRELLEETGYVAERFLPLTCVATEPSRHTTRAHFFVALGAHRAAEPCPDPSEDIRIVVLPKAELLAAVDAGQIEHGLHVAAILLAARRGLLD
jgi:8-oxo-dGTP pyrophosphatase MutT (NUDIX family)